MAPSKINKLKNRWKEALIKKELKEILACYSSPALFKGTMMNEAAKDAKVLRQYFELFAPIVKDVTFDNHVSVTKGNITNEFGSYTFYTTKGVVKANYAFVFEDKNGKVKIVSHFSGMETDLSN